MEKYSYVYILASKRNGTLYVGVTSFLARRISQHGNETKDGFSKRYGIHMLVHIETFRDIRSAIAREKQLKAGSRKKKLELIETKNPNWGDLSSEVFFH